MYQSLVSGTHKALVILGFLLAAAIGSFFFIHPAYAETGESTSNKSLPILLQSTQLVLESVSNKIASDEALVMTKTTAVDPQIASLMALLQQLIEIYTKLLAAQGQTVPGIEYPTYGDDTPSSDDYAELHAYIKDEAYGMNNNSIEFQLSLDVTAGDDDVYFDSNALGKFYQVYKDGKLYSYEKMNVVENIISDAKKVSDSYNTQFYRVREGETKNFLITVNLYPSEAGSYKLYSSGIQYRNVPKGLSTGITYSFDYTTDSVTWKNTSNTVQASIQSITDSENPIISGTAHGTKVVGFSIGNGDKVYGSGNISVVNGKWSHKVRTDLNAGEYEVILYINNTEYARKQFEVGENETIAPTMSLTVSPEVITEGQSATITWSSENTNFCSTGDKMDSNGALIYGPLFENKTVTVTCYGNGGSVSKSVTIIVEEPNSDDMSDVAPSMNRMSCANPLKTGLADGALACYGVWDYGGDFGNDENMCGNDGQIGYAYSNGGTGCKIQTNACASGSAYAVQLIKISSATSGTVKDIANRLLVTEEVLREGMVQVWEYQCIDSAKG